MKKYIALPVVLGAIALIFSSCRTSIDNIEAHVSSPLETLRIEPLLLKGGVPGYIVKYQEKTIIDTSRLGISFEDAEDLSSGFVIVNVVPAVVNETWEMPWGEQRIVQNNYREIRMDLEGKADPERKLNIYFRAYEDGVAFRYEVPGQEGKTLKVADELSQFNLTGDHTAWWQPGDWDMYEHLYNKTQFSEIDALSKRDHPNLASTYIHENAVNTPVTMRTESGLHLSFHEANLTDYSGMTLGIDAENLMMTSRLVGSANHSHKAEITLPFKSPWRTIQISETAAGLVSSNLIVNLNEPNKLGDVSWFEPMKYVGVWWEMHLGVSSWDLASGKHGATTENTKRYIDFAAANNIGGVLVEGWNTGWEKWIGFPDREGVFDFVTPYPDYDLDEVVRYADEKGVKIIMHHETSAAPRTYEQQMDTAYALMNKLGIHSVKTGYVGPIIPEGEYHHGQWMVRHYRKVLETAAKQQVAINAHEPIKATGIRRTLPNAISREGLRGQEFNAWSIEGGNPTDHLPNVVFTRMLGGPIDFTPGVFDIKLTKRTIEPTSQVNTTLAQQLALYVVIYSPIQMACDLPEHYKGQEALQFIREVGVDWEQTQVLNGEVGEFVTIAREERGTGNWFVGSITDTQSREIEIDFSFLEEGKTYTASIYADGPSAHWDNNPSDIEISNAQFTKGDKAMFKLAPGGGLAISLLTN